MQKAMDKPLQTKSENEQKRILPENNSRATLNYPL